MPVEKVKKMKSSSAEKRKKRAEEGRKAKATYNKIKREVMEHEPENFSKLYLVKSPGGKGNFWKMFEHSALLYHYKIAPRIGRDSRIYPDSDHDFRASHGVVSISNLKSLIELLGIIKSKLEYQDDNLVIFKLDIKYPREDILKLYDIEEEKVKRINTLVVPDAKLPQLQKKIKILSIRIHECVRKMEESTRNVFGASLDKDILWMHINVIQVQNNKDIISLEEFFDGCETRLQAIKASTLVALELRIFTTDQIFHILDEVEGVREQLGLERRRLTSEKAKKGRKKEDGAGRIKASSL